jgi:Arc/MetJ family transcription regulator
METAVAIVNFSVPDEVKAAFDKAFGEHNKSAIIAKLMRRAVRERQQQGKREKLFRRLTAARSARTAVTGEQIRRTRTAERP